MLKRPDANNVQKTREANVVYLADGGRVEVDRTDVGRIDKRARQKQCKHTEEKSQIFFIYVFCYRYRREV